MTSETFANDHADEAPLGPLHGVRVISVALNIPGPVAVARLVEMGAQASTVLPPSGDPMHAYRAEWFEELHRGQEVLTLDLKERSGRDRMEALLRAADVLVTSSRPSALRRLGLDHELLRARYPALCQVDIVGYPGVAAEHAGHDLTYQAVHGLVRGEANPPTLSVDLMGAERATAEVLAALLERARTGVGVRREVVLSEMAATLALPIRYELTTPGALLGGGLPFYAVYRARGGRVALAALEPHFVRALIGALAADGFAPDGEPLDPQDLTHHLLSEIFAQRSATAWQAWAQDRGIPLVAIAP